MFSKKFLVLTFSTVHVLPKRYAMNNKFCADFFYKRNNLYNFCYNCGVLRLHAPFENFITKSFTKTAKFQIRDSLNQNKNNNDIATYFHEIASLMNCNKTEIEKLFKEHPNLLTNIDLESTLAKLSLLLDKNFSKPEILKNIWILELSQEEIESRLNEIMKWELDSDVACKFLPLLKISTLDFYRMSAKFIVEKNMSKEKNRIIFIAKEMQCPIEKVVEKFLQFQGLLFRSFRQIQYNVKILKGKRTIVHSYDEQLCGCFNDIHFIEFEITSAELFQEFLVLSITPSKLKNRLEKLDKLGMKKHIWLVQSSEKMFDSKVQNEIEKISIMENWSSAEEYIYQTMKLSREEMTDLKIANPKIFKMNIVKLKKVLEFLLSCGYTTKQISLFPTVFNYDILRIQERYAELRTFGIMLPKIGILCVNQKYYDSLIERLKNKTSKKSSQKDQSTKKPSQ